MNKKLFLLTIIFTILVMPIYSYSQSQIERKDFVIAIDIGHSPYSEGAISSRGKGEYAFNRNIAEQLEKELINQGFLSAFIINKEGGKISLEERPAVAKERHANLFLSIHHDSVQPYDISKWTYNGEKMSYCDKYQGHSIFFSEKNKYPEKSLIFATLIGSMFRQNNFTPTLHHADKRELVDREKGIYKFDDLIVLKKATMPAVLFECGVIVNRNEEILLNNPPYQRFLVLTLADAIKAYWMTESKGGSLD